MSQNNKMKTKTSINFCVDDFLKYSKHRLIENRNSKHASDKTHSFNNSSNYNDKEMKTEITLDEDKDKIILRLNRRILELESRIQFLEAKINRNKEAITPTPKAKFMTISNSSQSLQRNSKLQLFKESLNKDNISSTVMPNKGFNKSKMRFILRLRSHSKNKEKEKDDNNRVYNIRRSPGDSYQISTINTNTNTDNNTLIGKSIEQKKHSTIQNSSQNQGSTEEGRILSRDHSLKSLKGFKIKRPEINGNKSTPCSIDNIKTIPKIPKKNSLLNKSIINATSIKDQLLNIKQRTEKLFGKCFENNTINYTPKFNSIISDDNNNEINTNIMINQRNEFQEQVLRRSLSEINNN